MIEIPEALVISKQLNTELSGKVIVGASAGMHPHKFTWYSGEPGEYNSKLTGRTVKKAYNHAARIFVELDNGMALVFGEGTRFALHHFGTKRPVKWQLLVDFENDLSLSVSIQMYGFILLEHKDGITNKYIVDSVEIPSPLDKDFDFEYFKQLYDKFQNTKMSTKEFLAAGQRIPGLGNGVLHDILFNARLHTKQKLRDYSERDLDTLYNSIINTLQEMVDGGGRDTEKGLYGESGGYKTKMSKYTVGKACPVCGHIIEKQSYMGGSIYFCPGCQKVQ
ncbi:MAG: DNA-formamidopyrimidine glycosylase family protein [Clostridia bacterium]